MDSKTAPQDVPAGVPPAYQPADDAGKQAPPPPEGHYNMQPMQGHATGMPLVSLGSYPTLVDCPNCHARGMTEVEYQSGGFMHAVAALVCCVTCLGCLPYLATSLKDARHKCSKCGIPLATYHRSGRVELHVQG